jgi:hypothetical protein
MVAGTKTAELFSTSSVAAALFGARNETLLTDRHEVVNTHFAFSSHFFARGARSVESVFG